MNCKICNSQMALQFTATVLNKYETGYYTCTSCGFMQTDKPFWLNEAYQNAINTSDTGILIRNQRIARVTTSIIYLFFNTKGKFIDYAGGYGIFTRIMRDIGIDFYWSDPYADNLLAKKFEIEPGVRYDLATSFESFEHFEDPITELDKILKISDNIIVTTELLPTPIPTVNDWWYYSPEHGQHISFYTINAFNKLASHFNLHYYNSDNVHLLVKKKLPLYGRWLFKIKYAKYILYVISFLITPLFKSKTFDDMKRLK